jgi:glyoxylase-like metal-dependent hydrolase (beta-lactamase superfamily II)
VKRATLLVTVLAIGALSMGLAAQRGQANPPKVISVDKIKDNLYVLKDGDGAGNTALFITANGAVVVDTKNPGWGQPLLAKIQTLTNKPVTTIINTHTHGDHTSGQVEFTGVNPEVVAQDNTKANMQRLDLYKDPKNAKFLPSKTFKDKTSLFSGSDRIDLYYFGPGHTNGDAWVVFPALRTAHAGDMFAAKGIPLVDYSNGGSGARYPQTLANAVAGLANVDTIITGHSDKTMTMADLKEYADFNRDFLAWVQSEMKAGKSAEKAAGEYKVPAKYKGYAGDLPPYFGGMTAYITGMYGELKK